MIDAITNAGIFVLSKLIKVSLILELQEAQIKWKFDEIGESLSPSTAPEIMAPATIGRGTESPIAKLINKGPRILNVPIKVPSISDRKLLIRKADKGIFKFDK